MSYTIERYKNNLHDIVMRLVEISNQCFEKALNCDASFFYHFYSNNQLMLLKDEQGGIQGLCLYDLIGTPKAVRVVYLAVMPDARGHNFGYHLIKKALEAAQGETSVPLAVVLNCRPRNESYYKKMGFFVYQPPTPDYYQVSPLALPAINMMATRLSLESERKIKRAGIIGQNLVANLIALITEIKQSTSFWYSIRYRSTRKEQAFDAIYRELRASNNTGMKINEQQAGDVLRAIISNALIIRGALSGDTTTSGAKVLSCLNSLCHARLKKIIADKDKLTIDDLVRFSELKYRHSQHFVGESPYCSFYKQKSNTSQDCSSLPFLKAANLS